MMTHDLLEAIHNVIKRRKARGAKPEDIEAYKAHLLTVWKHPAMQEKIKRYGTWTNTGKK